MRRREWGCNSTAEGSDGPDEKERNMISSRGHLLMLRFPELSTIEVCDKRPRRTSSKSEYSSGDAAVIWHNAWVMLDRYGEALQQ